MAAAAVVARNLLKNSKSLPQILRGQILGRSNVIANHNNIAKDHLIVQSLFVSNQKVGAQVPMFDFSEMGSLLGSSGGPGLVANGNGPGVRDLVIEARGKRVVKDEDDEEFVDDEDDESEGNDFDDIDADDMVDDDDDDGDYGDDDEDDAGGKFNDGKYKKKKFY